MPIFPNSYTYFYNPAPNYLNLFPDEYSRNHLIRQTSDRFLCINPTHRSGHDQYSRELEGSMVTIGEKIFLVQISFDIFLYAFFERSFSNI